MEARNGISASDLGAEGWVKPWSGSNGGDCLEAKKLPGGQVALRQSTDPHGPALILQPNEIRAFINGAKAGLADDLLTLSGTTAVPGQRAMTTGTFPDTPCPGMSAGRPAKSAGIRER
jgi:Domain of unknown function (DUF397)